MPRLERTSEFFKVKAQTVESEGARTYVFPEELKKVTYGVMASNPSNPGEMLISASGTVEQLKALAAVSGVVALDAVAAEQLMAMWRSP